MLRPRFLFVVMLWFLDLKQVAEAKEPLIREVSFPPEDDSGLVRVGGKPIVFYAGVGDMDDEVHFNAEAHQHPWLATSISMFILLFLIFFIIRFAESMG
mmetsp:Transcript_13327/g.27206  ORF Transcript_13327/g.27206 Transcript_13327/m.27206 type:complete len:99 (-) Transcript_13327:83-379(-)